MIEGIKTLSINRKLIIPSPSFIFYVIGAGGTGSYFIRDLARIVSIYNEKFKRKDSIIIVDADIVESKNLTRQNFVSTDIKKNKAKVLAKRYGSAFGIDISYIEEYLNDANKLEIIDSVSRGSILPSPIIIGCVDNNKTRKIINSVHRHPLNANGVYLDAGNEEFGGQVVFSTNAALSLNATGLYFSDNGNSRIVGLSNRIKDVTEYFELDNNDRHPEELSCAERAESAPQNIATNIMAANILFTYCNTILAGSINYNDPLVQQEISRASHKDIVAKRKNLIAKAPAISSHISFFNSMNGQISTLPFEENIQKLLEK